MPSRLLVALVVVVLAGCGGSSATSAPGGSATAGPAATAELPAPTVPPEVRSGEFTADQEQTVEIRDNGIVLTPPSLLPGASIKVAMATSADTPCDLVFLVRAGSGAGFLPLAPGDVERLLGSEPASSRYQGFGFMPTLVMHPGDPVQYSGLPPLPAGDYAWFCRVGAPGTPDPARFVVMSVAEPTPIPTPVPRTVTIYDLRSAKDGDVVRIVGYLGTGCEYTSGTPQYCWVSVADSMHRWSTTVEIPVTATTPPVPNTAASAGMLLTAEDGTAVRAGDGVAFTGSVDELFQNGLGQVTRIQAVPVPKPKVVTVTFKTLAKQKAETLVRLTGKVTAAGLDEGVWLGPRQSTTCLSTGDEPAYACLIYLDDPTSDASATIKVALGAKNKRTPNTMWPLPDDYSSGDLRLVANDGRLVGAQSRVGVTGFVLVDADGVRSIDVVRIDKVP